MRLGHLREPFCDALQLLLRRHLCRSGLQSRVANVRGATHPNILRPNTPARPTNKTVVPTFHIRIITVASIAWNSDRAVAVIEATARLPMRATDIGRSGAA